MGWYLVFLLAIALVCCWYGRDRIKLIWLSIILVCFSAFRFGFGSDYFMYITFIIHKFRHYEPIPAFLEQIAHDTHPQVFFVTTTLMISFLFLYPVYKKSTSPLISFFLYLGYPIFFFSHLSTIRQGLAIGFLFWALLITGHTRAAMMKKGLAVLLAALCHFSCVVGILSFLRVEKIPKEILWLGLLLSIAIGQLFPPLLLAYLPDGFFSIKLSQYLDMKAQGQTLVTLLMYATTILMMVYHDVLVSQYPQNARFINWLYVGVILFNLFSVNLHMAIRFYGMFASPLLLLMPDLIRALKVPRAFFYAICVAAFALNIWSAERFNDGRHHYYPYQTVFETSAVEWYRN